MHLSRIVQILSDNSIIILQLLYIIHKCFRIINT
nr:MAG TPA: hypothetical protein [Caudoviricetes sp.]